jgi:DnaJ-class molecular chaperone
MIKLGDSGFQQPLEPPVKIDGNIDYYAKLECDPSASATEIKTSYHRLAKKYHPDRSSGSHELFHEIKLAIDILGDPTSKQKYDAVRLRGVLDP